jgi:hypothetical protein
MEHMMAHNPKHGNSRSKAMSGHEADAQLLREKTARLRELRLAHEAANGTPAKKTVAKGPATSAAKPAKSTKKVAPSLSEWLDAQQKEGRRG